MSPAARTRETWSLLAAELPEPPTATFPKVLYLATPERLLTQVRKTPESITVLLVIGHNPGLEAFARRLAGSDSEPEALARLTEKFPTAALARLVFEDEWVGLDFAGARLTYCLRPKDLG